MYSSVCECDNAQKPRSLRLNDIKMGHMWESTNNSLQVWQTHEKAKKYALPMHARLHVNYKLSALLRMYFFSRNKSTKWDKVIILMTRPEDVMRLLPKIICTTNNLLIGWIKI